LFQERADNAQNVIAFMRAGFAFATWRPLFGATAEATGAPMATG